MKITKTSLNVYFGSLLGPQYMPFANCLVFEYVFR